MCSGLWSCGILSMTLELSTSADVNSKIFLSNIYIHPVRGLGLIELQNMIPYFNNNIHFIFGDCNGHSALWNYDNDNSNNISQWLEELIFANGLQILNDKSKGFTRFPYGNQRLSNVDLTMCNRLAMKHFVSWCPKYNFSWNSDHIGIVTQISLDPVKSKPFKKKSFSKANWANIKEEVRLSCR